ncbi:MAG: hypothetical protein AAFR44_14945, partial [Pseudomonadota bacterium]
MVEITNDDELKAWLRDRPAEDYALIAARVALRVFPMLGPVLDYDAYRRRVVIILPVFRALSVASFSGTWPAQAIEVRNAATLAARAASAAPRAADHAATDAAAAAAAAARTTVAYATAARP